MSTSGGSISSDWCMKPRRLRTALIIASVVFLLWIVGIFGKVMS